MDTLAGGGGEILENDIPPQAVLRMQPGRHAELELRHLRGAPAARKKTGAYLERAVVHDPTSAIPPRRVY
jgi:hypothetical protein